MADDERSRPQGDGNAEYDAGYDPEYGDGYGAEYDAGYDPGRDDGYGDGGDAGREPGRDGGGPQPRRLDPTLATFGGGILVGALLLGVIWSLIAIGGGDDDASARSGSATASTAAGVSGGAGQAPAPGTTGLSDLGQRCSDAAHALTRPLDAAAPAMDQWAVHIGAMNKLVVGAISLPQANAFWARTRVGAQRHIAQFRSAVRELRGRGVDCPAPDVLPASAPTELRACSRRAYADLRTLRAARTAVNTWAMHVADMERLRAGTLSPADATRMWLEMWKQGQDQLDAYRAAARAARQAGSC